MSTLKADTIVGADGTSPVTLTKQSAAKVTGNLQGDGSSNSTVSLNISSVTDGSAGLNTVAVTNAFTAALAVAALIANHDSSYNRTHTVDDTSASSFITRSVTASGGTLTDTNPAHSIAFFGDLA
jgi:hypothetical protein